MNREKVRKKVITILNDLIFHIGASATSAPSQFIGKAADSFMALFDESQTPSTSVKVEELAKVIGEVGRWAWRYGVASGIASNDANSKECEAYEAINSEASREATRILSEADTQRLHEEMIEDADRIEYSP